ncbi:retinoic acid-induced protein 1 [Periophthalmus magnuspinnatus]|uniref:retinoic acid-induced protein 1 n=1 Tax=Periophthalmus magnuspinnatus TaxID=409849 RepID=UPI002436CE33|nr:retinoic acid-induced protein 1 [Periophthalmus magnuspinnatus]
MQSFRERSTGYHSNQPCYQQEPHELSRLDTYRQHPQHPHTGPGPHLGHSRPGYDTHPLTSPSSMAPAGGGTKDCYSQQAFASFPGNGGGNGNGVSAKKTYRGGSKAPTQTSGNHLQGPTGYSHMGPGSYSAQYLSEGHIQQKWDDPSQLSQYEQDIVARMEASTPTPGSSQYIDQNMLGQTQCHQPTTPAYTSPHHQPHVPNPPPSPLMYPQSHLHYPQQSPSPYMDKCSTMPHCYKGYNMPPNTQYSRQMGTHSSLKQGQYRQSQSSYGYQQPTPRGYEPHTPLQNLSNPQEPHPKYQHYNQTQQNYCLTDMPVRSPEQYYQTCSPASSHSPARSVGRSPSYSSTPSPLMTNPESFQYGQPSMTPSSSSSSTSAMQEQGNSSAMLMPPRSHPSPSVAHAAPHSYTSTPQLPTMKERFSEKLLSNPSLWSLNALTSQVENISNNVQQLLLSEALVGNKKSGKRSSGGSNSSIGSGTPSKKSEEYKSPLYADGSGVGGAMQDPYSTTQHHTLPMELHEAGYSSSSDEQLERGYYYCSQGRSPAQAQNNTSLCLDTTSSCSITSPDDMSIRSGDSGVHNLTPDPAICTPAQGGDGMSTPAKSISDERSPTSITVSSPLKQDRDSPPDIETIDEPLKENFEESTWPDKCTDKNEITEKITNVDEDIVQSAGRVEHWTAEGNDSQRYSKEEEREKSYCYDSPEYQEDQRKYEITREDSLEQSPSGLSFSNDKEQEVKSETFKSDSRTSSESSVKTSPYVSRGELEQDQYSTEKEDSSENTSPPPRMEEEDITQKEERGIEAEAQEEGGEEGGIQEEEPQTLSPPLSAEDSKDVEVKEGIGTPEHPEEFVPVHLNTAADVSSRETPIGDTAPQPESAMPVFSSLNDKTAPAPAHTRDHMDHSDAKVLEPDSPQLPGKSILPSAPSWADTPPSPKKGDEDIEPGISCASAVTPSTKPEPLAPTAQPRTYGRKHTRGRRRMHSGSGLRRQLSLETEEEKGEESVPSSQKPCMPMSKTGLISDQTELMHPESNVSPAAKIITDVFSSRMCTRSFNAPELSPKDKPPLKRKPGPKPGPKPKPGAKPNPKPRVQPSTKPAPKSFQKTALVEPEIPPKGEITAKQKQGPKPRAKPGPKPGSKHTPNPEPTPEEALPPTDAPPAKSSDSLSAKTTAGRPKGAGPKSKNTQEVAQPSEGMQSRRKRALLEAASAENPTVKPVNAEEKTHVKALQRATKNMVLRSRKPSQEKATKEKINGETVDVKTAEPRVSDVKVEATLTEEENLTPLPDVKTTDVPAELSEPPKPVDPPADINTVNTTSLKRKNNSPPSSIHPVKKKRGPKPRRRGSPQVAQVEEDVSTAEEVTTRPSKRRQASQNKCSSSTSPTNETDNSDTPAHCPTKTKVLPPRKGRGQKYEALVQKMTSPGSKKQQILQPDSLTDELASKVPSQNSIKGTEMITNAADIMEEMKNTDIKQDEVKEQEMPVKVEEDTKSQIDEGVTEEKNSESDRNNLAQTEESSTQQNSTNLDVRAEGTQEKTCVPSKPVKAKKKRWAIVESTEAALETESLIVTTPRLAKQRAIKNNHEMHLKQRRKKRKEVAEVVSEANAEGKVETEQEEQVEQRATDSTAHVPLSTVTEPVQMSSSELTEKPKRGRKPSVSQGSRKRGKTSTEHMPEKLTKLHRKPGPKPGMKDAMEVIEAVVRAAGCEQAEKEEREKEEMEQKERDSKEKEEEPCIVGPVVTLSEKQSETICVKKFRRRPVSQNSKLSFCPYVRLSNSRDFSSWCAIVNKPEDAVVFQRRRKKGILRMKNPFTVAKGVPHTAAMLQGPLVNKALMDRCLNCSLCGKPANYRDLGDLCGPFYAEDDVPRKILTSSPTDLIREITDEASCSKSSINTELVSCSKDEGESDTKTKSTTDSLAQEGSSQQRHRRYRRPEGSDCIPRRGGLRRVTLRERFRRIQQLKAKGTSETDETESLLQRLQQEAETKEHWAHENCAIWTRGVVMVAGRLYGLKEAAKTSDETSCYKCQNVGASLSCCWRGCSNKYHYVCAKEIGCTFHEDDFSIKCPKHEVR